MKLKSSSLFWDTVNVAVTNSDHKTTRQLSKKDCWIQWSNCLNSEIDNHKPHDWTCWEMESYKNRKKSMTNASCSFAVRDSSFIPRLLERKKGCKVLSYETQNHVLKSPLDHHKKPANSIVYHSLHIIPPHSLVKNGRLLVCQWKWHCALWDASMRLFLSSQTQLHDPQLPSLRIHEMLPAPKGEESLAVPNGCHSQ